MAGTLSPAVTVRKAEVIDAGPASAMGRVVFSATFGHSVTPEQLATFLDQAYTPESFAKEIRDQSRLMLVAEVAGTMAGFITLARETDEPCVSEYENRVELGRLYVGLDNQGQGVGKVLSNEIEEVARREGYRYMWLGVWEENYKAQAVYKKLGYKRVGEHVFDVGGDLQTDHIMIKEL
ncbi:hypothetical protein CAC42_6977 [Sphaceloma murrayae]|uniref:N-acetyltransferase domain-containing protein n=1 Tax=Sphaceloma murrayae TaxID=2082308 RepID=A0A2K1QQE6_9PEZI|nr:hypothetical protein CAC42_6977 [Sphaceloma murrayae]